MPLLFGGVGRYRRKLKEILNKEISSLFLKNSFIQNGGAFYKVEPEIVKYIDLEYFRFNTYANFFYWFNLHLFYGNFQSEQKINLKLLLTKGSCAFTKRLGFLWDEEQHMYQINSATELWQLTAQMKKDIEQQLLPFFEMFHNLDDILKYLKKKNEQLGNNYYSYMMALVLAKAGRMAESKKFLLESDVSREIMEKTARAYLVNDN